MRSDPPQDECNVVDNVANFWEMCNRGGEEARSRKLISRILAGQTVQ